jgi:hypothetical protein
VYEVVRRRIYGLFSQSPRITNIVPVVKGVAPPLILRPEHQKCVFAADTHGTIVATIADAAWSVCSGLWWKYINRPTPVFCAGGAESWREYQLSWYNIAIIVAGKSTALV